MKIVLALSMIVPVVISGCASAPTAPASAFRAASWPAPSASVPPPTAIASSTASAPLVSTLVLTTTSTPFPTVVPTVQEVSVDRPPKITYDLLFISQYRLMRWDHIAGQIETLVGPREASGAPADNAVLRVAGPGIPAGGVVSFSVSADGERVAIARITSPSQTHAEIAMFDMTTRQVIPLGLAIEPNAYGPYDMAISPDGEWIAYTKQSSPQVSDHGAGLAVYAALPASGDNTGSVAIYAIQVDLPHQRIQLGSCTDVLVAEYNIWGCGGFLWSPDSRAIIWSDGRGMWLTEVGQPARLVAASTQAGPYQEGRGMLRQVAWSSLGRYVLASIVHYEGSPEPPESKAIIDTQTGRIAVVPDSLSYSYYYYPRITWLSDGRLFILRTGNEANDFALSGEVWRIDPDVESMMIRDAGFAFGIGSNSLTTELTPLADGRVAFALLNASPVHFMERGLYILDPAEGVPRKVNDLFPTEPDNRWYVQIIWSPDGGGALVQDLDKRKILYAPTRSGFLYNLRKMIDSEAHSFTWSR